MLRNLRARWRRLPENPYWVRSRPRTPGWLLGLQWLLALVAGPALALLAYGDSPQVLAQGASITFFGVTMLWVWLLASYGSGTALASERQKETLLPLALTRLDSADIADGVAFSTLRPLARQAAMAAPSLAVLGVVSGMSLFTLTFFAVQLVMFAIILAYQGVTISAKAESTRQAGLKAVMLPGFVLLVLPFFFAFGGCLALPLWLVHPFFAFGLAWGGFDMPFEGVVSVVFWKGWVLLSLLGYAGLIVALRNQAIQALGRARLF